MKPLFFTLLISLTLAASAQDGITFQVEELSKPKIQINASSSREVYEDLIRSDANVSLYDLRKSQKEFPYGIVAYSTPSDSLVKMGYHPFFQGMYWAYANHHPFVLSPDMIWLLISQGFARHVNADPERVRKHFVNFSGKLSLIVPVGKEFTLDNPNAPWETVFSQFTKQIGEHAETELTELLTSNFSTTGIAEKVASQITVMEAMKPYFEFITMRIVCGIPEITLKGTPKDWQKILDRTEKLGSKYDLTWWTDQLTPLLKEFVKTSKGTIDKEFWKNMFKQHSSEGCGDPGIMDGWIVRFFPYDKHGNRNSLKEIKNSDNLPSEIVKVDLTHYDSETQEQVPLELWAGFVGLEYNRKNLALTPRIGWMIRKKDVSSAGFKQMVDMKGSLRIRVKEFPPELLELDTIKTLRIEFVDGIDIPDRLASVKIGSLILKGEINEAGIERLKNMFPNAKLIINAVPVHEEGASLYNGLYIDSIDD